MNGTASGGGALYIRTFGACHLERDGTRVEALASKRRALAFLALVGSTGAKGVSRDAAAAYFWPESDEAHARSSLKQLIHAIRTELGPDILVSTGALRLNPTCASSDVGAFIEAVEGGRLEEAARIYTGPFLDGFHVRGAGPFEEWVSEQRAVLARRFADVVRHLAEQVGQGGDRTRAVQWWQRLVDADRLSSTATLGLMRALDAADDRAAALRQASQFQQLIRDELSMAPDSAVAELVVRFRTSPAHGAVARAGTERDVRLHGHAALAAEPAVPPRTVLVVLPLANTSAETQDDHFSDGLTDELIGTLSKIRGIAVVGRTSAFAFKGQHVDVATVARTLSATSVLEGSVRRFASRVKVGVQLVRASDGVVLWSESYDREARDIFAVQAEIARAVALALQVQLDPTATGVRADTADEIARDQYLQGRYHLNRVSQAELKQAVACFERAVARDPTYASAYAGLADAHLLLAIMGHAPAEAEVARVHAAVSRALALGGDLAEAHTALACVLFAFEWEWDAAEREFQRAIALDPGYALAHHRYGLYLMYRSRTNEAQQVLERALASDPLAASVTMNLGRLHLSARRAAVAIPLLQKATELSPRLALAHESLGHALALHGLPAEALAAFRRASDFAGARGRSRLAYGLAFAGDVEGAHALLQEVETGADAEGDAFGLALVHTALGSHDQAFAWLARARTSRDAFLHTINSLPAFEPLHQDARWPQLLQSIGLGESA